MIYDLCMIIIDGEVTPVLGIYLIFDPFQSTIASDFKISL